MGMSLSKLQQKHNLTDKQIKAIKVKRFENRSKRNVNKRKAVKDGTK